MRAPQSDPPTSLDYVTPAPSRRERSARPDIAGAAGPVQCNPTREAKNVLDPEKSADRRHAAADLLYGAQLDLIGHKTADALAKLETSADLGSSAACSTLANLLACGWRHDILTSPVHSPTSPGLSDGGSKEIKGQSRRPALQSRQRSTWASDKPSQHYSNVLKATSYFIRGLEIELQLRPTSPAGSPRPPDLPVLPNDDGADESDEQDSDDACSCLDRTLDLLLGIADSHRFGILHAPDTASLDRCPASAAEDPNDEMWRASGRCCAVLLARAGLSTVLNGGAESSSTSTMQIRELVGESADRRTPGEAVHTYKQRCGVIIVALYVLALQAWSSSGPSTSSSPPGSPPPEKALVAQRYWNTIGDLADRLAVQGGLGNKAVEELVARARYRLEATSRRDLGASEPWRMAKKIGKAGECSAPPQAAGRTVTDHRYSPGLRLLHTVDTSKESLPDSRGPQIQPTGLASSSNFTIPRMAFGLTASASLPRATSAQSIRSSYSATSALSSFRHNPLQRYLEGRLERVPSNASICAGEIAIGTTTGPDHRGETAASRGSAARKTWLSRFWHASTNSAGPPVDGSRSTRTVNGSRSQSQSALDHLRRTLDRHEAARASLIDYWSETEFLEDEDGGIDESFEVAPDDNTSSPITVDEYSTISHRAQRLHQSLEQSAADEPSAPELLRSQRPVA
ncbi:hypothetical protein JCM3774_006505 [Rhodotorula dairenensis]